MRRIVRGIWILALVVSYYAAGQQNPPSPAAPPAANPQEQQQPAPDKTAPPPSGESTKAEQEKQTPSPATPLSATEQAWNLIEGACDGTKVNDRAVAIRVLGLVPNNARARKLAEHALVDEKPEVRSAAAVALGDMNAKSSIPKLREALDDSDVSVALAAAHALHLMHDSSAYGLYFEILSGDRKGSKGLIASQTAVLKDKKKLAMLGFQEGIGFIPFAGIGWEAFRTVTKDDSSPVRAAAAKVLAKDPDPASGTALEDATGDKNWLVRVAALEALAERGDPSAIKTVKTFLTDEKVEVRFTAAAAVLRLSQVKQEPASGETKKNNKGN